MKLIASNKKADYDYGKVKSMYAKNENFTPSRSWKQVLDNYDVWTKKSVQKRNKEIIAWALNRWSLNNI